MFFNALPHQLILPFFQMIDSQLELAGKIPAKGVAGGQFDMENEKF